MYLIINLGLKSIRGIVFNKEGNQIFSTSRAVYSKLYDQKVEQDPEEWNLKLEEILLEIGSNDYLNHEIEYITSTTSSSCIFGMDSNGKPTTKVMMVSDKRAHIEAAEIRILMKEYAEDSELICPESSIIPKAKWFKKNRPDIFERTACWMGAGEFLNHYFTGEIFTDELNASKGLYEKEKYLDHVIEKAGIPISMLPEVKPMGSTFTVRNSLVNKYSLSKNCKYVLTTYDAICAVIGSHDGSTTTACDVSGTVTSVRILAEKSLKDKTGLILTQKLGPYDKFLIGASNNLGGGIIEWLKQAFYNESDKNVYYIMENNAHQVSIGAHGIVFLPYMLGERSPFKNPNARGVFFGVDRGSTKNEFSRAVFESTAYVANDLLQLIIQNGVKVDSMSVSGGLARFDLINQIKADVTNKRIKVIENFESTSVGAFILLALSIGEFSSIAEAAKETVRIRKIINPSEKNHSIYKEFFEFFKDLNNRLMPLYDQHVNLKSHIRSFSSETISNL